MSSDVNVSHLRVRRLVSSAEPEFDALLRIYAGAHPPGELKAASTLVQMIERPEYIFLAAIQGPSVAAFSISICFRDSDAALLEYIAVDPAKRSQGIGAVLFKETAEFEGIAGRYLLIEADSDRLCSPAEHVDRLRRKSFYRRLGCMEIEGLTYIMPPVSTALPPPMEMLVYRSSLPHSIEKSRIRSWLEDCYSQVYHLPSDDRRIHSMVENLLPDVRLI